MGQVVSFDKALIFESATLREAMSSLNESTWQIALVVDAAGGLLGSVTDGDIRRGILSGIRLEDPVVEVMNKKPKVGFSHETPAEWDLRMRRHALQQLPILQDGRLVNLYISASHAKFSEIDNAVVLMLGGLGMRLRPLTESLPKPMLKVGGKPIVEIIFEQFISQGFKKFYFCINYLGEVIRQYFGDGSRWNVAIEYIEEHQRMGTAGALTLLPKQDAPMIVMNGDLLTKVDMRELLAFHLKNKAKFTLCLREYAQQVPYGVIETDGVLLKAIHEKPVTRHHINAGIYVVQPESIEQLPLNQFYDMPSLIEKLLSQAESVACFPVTEYWMDIGQLPDFEQAQLDYRDVF
jgi:dTDP-glucose pyrophosphorylase